MRDFDIHALFHVIRKPGMYAGTNKIDDFKRIDSFLLAYEMGSMRECDFRSKLIRQIETKYGVFMPSEGLVKQLRIAARKVNQDVHAFFLNESMEILIAESDKDGANRFVNDKRMQLIEILEKLSDMIDMTWDWNFKNQIRDLQDWKGANLTLNETNHIEKLINEIRLIEKDILEPIEVPKQVERAKEELLELLKVNVKY